MHVVHAVDVIGSVVLSITWVSTLRPVLWAALVAYGLAELQDDLGLDTEKSRSWGSSVIRQTQVPVLK